MRNLIRTPVFTLVTAALVPSIAHAVELQEGFEAIELPATLSLPTDVAFAPDGTIFIAEQSGIVRVHDGATQQAVPFIDLSEEVNSYGHRGLLGIALHPDFVPNGGATSWVYLQYTASPVSGADPPPDAGQFESFGRLTRYRATTAGSDIVAVIQSRQVLLGHRRADGVVPDGIASCDQTHASGTMAFADDGSLLLTNGDGAHAEAADHGGVDPGCFSDFVHPITGKRGPMRPYEDSGAYRVLDLRSLAGKLLRIDPQTGQGYASNPFFDGNPSSNASRIWARGLRNPYRFGLKPGTGAQDPALGQPNTVYVGDVGWNDWEEIDVVRGGENFGWPCFEGMLEQPDYQAFERGPDPLQRPDCDIIPAPRHTQPLLAWNHIDAAALSPPGFHFDELGNPLEGFTGASSTGGAFYTGGNYPDQYDGRYFFGDYEVSWIRTIETDDADNLVAVRDFGLDADGPVAFQRHPLTGDIWFVAILTNKVYRIAYVAAH